MLDRKAHAQRRYIHTSSPYRLIDFKAKLVILRTCTDVSLHTAASKLAMSTLSSQALWEKSGRLKKDSEVNISFR